MTGTLLAGVAQLLIAGTRKGEMMRLTKINNAMVKLFNKAIKTHNLHHPEMKDSTEIPDVTIEKMEGSGNWFQVSFHYEVFEYNYQCAIEDDWLR